MPTLKPPKNPPPQIKRLKRTIDELWPVLRACAPRASRKTVSYMANILGSLEEVSYEHIRLVRSIKKCRYPRDCDKLLKFLVHIEVNWLSTGSYDLDELRQFLPRLEKYVTVPRKASSKSRIRR